MPTALIDTNDSHVPLTKPPSSKH